MTRDSTGFPNSAEICSGWNIANLACAKIFTGREGEEDWNQGRYCHHGNTF